MSLTSSTSSDAAAGAKNAASFYINGEWVPALTGATLEVINPATETPIATIALGTAADVDRAVEAARAAFGAFSATSASERADLLRAVQSVYERRSEDLAVTVSQEMGAPLSIAREAQVPLGAAHLQTTLAALEEFQFEQNFGTNTVVHEPIGVCALITPWNWPLNQIMAKVAPALAAGCTMVLKPSEIAPLNALLLAEIMDEAGVPAGVFNLVNGEGPEVGAALSSHPDVDFVSITGSTRAGIEVARNAAPTVKRVTQELGGKSANLILDDADLDDAVRRDISLMYINSGQTCTAGSRMLVPKSRLAEVIEIAQSATEQATVGAPEDAATAVGPVASQAQYDKIQRLIASGVAEGASVVAGGLGRPAGIERGYYVQPTVLAHVTNDMTIAREEIFGPVITIIAYEDDAEAIAIANDSDYGLSGMVSSGDPERARKVARQMRTGMVHINGAQFAFDTPFGGYKQSGNGREMGSFGLREFLETKTIFGDVDA